MTELNQLHGSQKLYHDAQLSTLVITSLICTHKLHIQSCNLDHHEDGGSVAFSYCRRYSGQYLGPYNEIYPFVDITRDQQSCVPDFAASGNGTCPLDLYIALMMSFGGDFVSN